MKSRESILIIGGGAVVHEYYLPALQYLKLIDSTTILEPNPKAASLLKEAGLNVVEKTFDNFFTEEKINYDYAIITVPNHLHEAAIIACLTHNITVLCEKPLCLNMESVARIRKAEKGSSKNVYTGMVRRYLPSFKALKRSLELIGEIKEVNISDGNPYAWVADSYAFFDPKNGGVLADMGSHYLDLAYHLFGTLEPQKYTDDREGGVDANCEYSLITSNNIPIQLNLSRTHKLENRFEVKGSKGKIWIEKDDFKCCYYSTHNHATHEIKIDDAFKTPDLQYIFESCFVEQLLSLLSNDESLVKLNEAAEVVNLIEWAYSRSTDKSSPKSPSEDSYYITGGTGFIGTALIERLWENGIKDILAPVRSYKNCAPIARLKIDLPRINLLDYQAVKTSLDGKKYIVHLAYSTDGNNAYAMNVEATQNVVKAACESGAEAVVVLSTMNVYGFPDGIVNETSAQHPAGGDYGKTKKIMQKWCLDFAKKQNKTRIVILNPTCVYGPNGKTYTTLPINLAKANRFCWIDQGQGNANIVYIDNLLDAIQKALKTPEAHGQNFIINDGTITWKEFLSPLLGNYASETPNLSTEELLKGKFNQRTSTKQIFRFLLTNYELVELINSHPFFGKLKKMLFKSLPSFRGQLDQQRQKVWSASDSIKLSKNNKEKFNPPAWLNELFGMNKSSFSSEKASKVLKWSSKTSIESGLSKTKNWLENK